MNYKIANNGFSPKLVENSIFKGKYEIPLIKDETIEDVGFKNIGLWLPFDKRNSLKEIKYEDVTIHFYMNDYNFKQIFNNPEKYIEKLKKFRAVISPDFSIYTDMPLAIQISHTYLNRAIGSFYQNSGIKVIPNVRWGDSRTYEFCFDGLEKKGTYAIGSHGTMKKNEDRHYFVKGLEEFIKRLDPKTIYVYGTMPDEIFGQYKEQVNLINIESDISKVMKDAI